MINGQTALDDYWKMRELADELEMQVAKLEAELATAKTLAREVQAVALVDEPQEVITRRTIELVNYLTSTLR